ncbi:fibroblast growth factor receptor-like [Lingula anatina]|uniref:Fibroblast growth factor receptor-like n=1 Tax=Lingula anatina TaxID=7574 RepID=A0A1S3J9R0_LINAN|nr:fibroblast growth factor receptor-like [Lingula anatina]|eukprot:XP_013407058.1 fibroblast growth factor receptor-like [Lingula anatina]
MQNCWKEIPSERCTFKELAEKFDKILQLVANKEYLDIQPSNNMATLPVYLGDEDNEPDEGSEEALMNSSMDKDSDSGSPMCPATTGALYLSSVRNQRNDENLCSTNPMSVRL